VLQSRVVDADSCEPGRDSVTRAEHQVGEPWGATNSRC
jgi:hypothetical protein